MKLLDQKPEEVLHICTFCQLKNDKECSPEEIETAFETKDCGLFLLGQCFNCKIQQDNDNKKVVGVCSQHVDFEGCENYKPN